MTGRLVLNVRSVVHDDKGSRRISTPQTPHSAPPQGLGAAGIREFTFCFI